MKKPLEKQNEKENKQLEKWIYTVILSTPRLRNSSPMKRDWCVLKWGRKITSFVKSLNCVKEEMHLLEQPFSSWRQCSFQQRMYPQQVWAL